MSIQDILRIMGVVLLVAAAVLAVAAAYTYRALDIRGVKDDLAGRRRETPSTGGARPRIHRQVGEKVEVASVQVTGQAGDSKRHPPSSPAPSDHAATPAVEFRVTRKEIVATSEKTLEE